MSDRELLTECLDVLTHDAAQRTFAGGVRMSQLAIKLRTHLAAPRPEPVLPEAITCGMPFVIKHYTADLRPTIKGNGFDGLEIGISREEAEEFVAWVNARIAAPPAAAPEPGPEPATDAKLLLAYRQRGCGFYMEFREIWQAAERFHGITKEDKT